MDNKILSTNTRLDIDEITEKVNALRKALLDGVAKVLPMVINTFKSTIRDLRVNALLRDYYRECKYGAMRSSMYFCKAAKRYPKLKHLAIHGKKRRIRRKNIKRLYKLGEFYYKNKYPYAFL